MSIRHELAIRACATTDLLELSRYLAGAVQEAIQEGQLPHLDPAIRLISHHIAFAGNGDLPFQPYYEKAYEYCKAKIKDGPHAIYWKDTNERPKYEPE